MKISILGKGLAGCYAALYFETYTKHEIEVIYTSDKSHVPYGQGTFPNATVLFTQAHNPNWYDNPFKATIKKGILYENWGTKTEKWFHPFPFAETAMHYDIDAVINYICDKGKFNIIDKNITNYNEIDADYILDGRGVPSNLTNYHTITTPINSVILGKKDEVKPKQLWTGAIATPNGWTFDIPLTDYTSLGYLYNKNITSYNEALENFKELFDPSEIVDSVNFNSYVAKDPIIDERIFLIGSKLFFIEPLEAAAVASYISWAWFIKQFIQKEKTKELLIKDIHSMIYQIQNFLLYHYMFGSKWGNTPFWNYCKSLVITDPTFWKVLNYSKNAACDLTDQHTEMQQKHYGLYYPYSFKKMYYALN